MSNDKQEKKIKIPPPPPPPPTRLVKDHADGTQKKK